MQITATVQNNAAVTKTVALTVAGAPGVHLDRYGQRNQRTQATQYAAPYVIQVTDSTGAGVKGVTLAMSVLSQRYFKGYRVAGTSTWATCYTIPQDAANCIVGTPPTDPDNYNNLPLCKNEDSDYNGNAQFSGRD